ncbi:MAG: LacI family DNA-binding transcriptional regulator [Pseudomonadota bacterium]
MAFALRRQTSYPPLPRQTARVTMKDVAAIAGVTSMTVSRALHRPEMVADATRERVLEVVAETGFIPNLAAGTLSATRSRIVTAVVATLAEPGAAEIVSGLSDTLSEAGYQLLLNQSRFDPKTEEALLRAALGWTPAAVVMSGMTHTRATRLMLQRAGVPVIEMNEIDSRPIDMAVGLSNFEGGRESAVFMAKRGSRRIGFLHGSLRHNERVRRRRDGFLKGLVDAGLEAEPGLTLEIEANPHGGARGLATMLERYADLDGIVAATEREAVGVLQECLRRGLDVPGRIAIMGWGDSELSAEMVPALTTVHTRRYEIGYRTGQVILNRLEGRKSKQNVIDLGFEIVARQST